MKRSTPLKPSGFKRKPGAAYSSFEPRTKPFENTADRSTSLRRSSIKQRTKKPTNADGAKYLAACKDEPCYLNVCCPWTDWADPTVVPCHSNQARHGKGGNLKADNEFTVPGCGLCHAWIDQNRVGTPRQYKFDVWDAAYERWRPRRARKMGLQIIPADLATT
ncbi:hypothetical protein [Caballeronia sordidicola]|uniref:Phage protein n=1 Tax=Caballeronia sordidicola TaxID=196367 RepID=A0A242N767_CABSO|nr:hypothetical protein [Caballeronia sordidicola]OTP79468.1 hypothetical protein PAMC26577_00975 [Caballeronia sordidicola]